MDGRVHRQPHALCCLGELVVFVSGQQKHLAALAQLGFTLLQLLHIVPLDRIVTPFAFLFNPCLRLAISGTPGWSFRPGDRWVMALTGVGEHIPGGGIGGHLGDGETARVAPRSWGVIFGVRSQ